jgi:hypothetical protein
MAVSPTQENAIMKKAAIAVLTIVSLLTGCETQADLNEFCFQENFKPCPPTNPSDLSGN